MPYIDIHKLSDHKLIRTSYDNSRNSAVLILLVEDKTDETGWSILFEVRASNIGQGGEICFPGGRIENNEHGTDAAIRETCEELLVDREQIELIAPIVQITGPKGGFIKSYLGVLRRYNMTYFKDEVDHVFKLPLSYFMNNEPITVPVNYKVDLPDDFPFDLIPHGRDYPFATMKRNISFYKTQEGTIWGLTAEILKKFISII